MDLFNLSGVISLNADKFNKQAEEADKRGKKLGERLKDITDTAAGRLLSRGIEELGSAIVGVSKKAIQLAGDLEQNLGGALAVFGEENFWALEKAGKQAFKSMGISYSDFLQRANKMGSLLQGSGIETTKSMEMSVEWMQRASDVASIMGIDVGDAMQAIEGAAKGNFTINNIVRYA